MTVQLSPLTFPRAQFDEVGEAVFTYHMLRVARRRFQSGLATLTIQELTEVTREAEQTFELENLVLASPETLGVVITPMHIDLALNELAAGYPDRETFAADLELDGLTIDSLAPGLHRQMVYDAVMQRVGARHIPVAPTDEQIYYQLHQEEFTTPERRTARHLLIAVNMDGSSNPHDAALARIEWLAGQMQGHLQGSTGRFAYLARRHSECATAVEGGWLGEVKRGELDPRLDEVLFALSEGAVSGPVETALGFHLICCERIQPADALQFSQVQGAIRALLIERRRSECQTSWLAKLRQPKH